MEVNFTAPLTLRIAIDEQTQVGQARRETQQLARMQGFDETDAGRAALVATELGTNILKHGRGGHLYVMPVVGRDCAGLELVAVDRGPGFSLAEGLRDGYSTQGTKGIGLGGVHRQTQWLDAYSDERGAVVGARLYPGGRSDVDLPYGGWRLPMHDESVCGDAWHIRHDGERWTAVIIDGLGHGAAAHVAANAGIGAAADHRGDASAVAMLAALHRAMTGTRGGAAAVAEYADGVVRFTGTGNISAALIDTERSRGLPSHPGIVGVGPFSRSQTDLLFPEASGKLLVLHSDGLQARWSLKDYPGLATRHPALVAAVLFRDFDRARDDSSLLVLRLG